MRKDSKKYYFSLQQDVISSIKGQELRPSLLMHTCCCVCACWPIQYLSDYFDLTLFYYNDNIYPEEEYEKRFHELERYVKEVNEKYYKQVKIIKSPYHGKEYMEMMVPYKDSPEGGQRCQVCFDYRMSEGMRYAVNNHYDYFTTVMTISRQKDSITLNKIGEKLQEEYPEVKYFFSDFKKDGGLEKSNQLVREYDIYRQNYCGCVYSYGEMLKRARKEYAE